MEKKKKVLKQPCSYREINRMLVSKTCLRLRLKNISNHCPPQRIIACKGLHSPPENKSGVSSGNWANPFLHGHSGKHFPRHSASTLMGTCGLRLHRTEQFGSLFDKWYLLFRDSWTHRRCHFWVHLNCPARFRRHLSSRDVLFDSETGSHLKCRSSI